MEQKPVLMITQAEWRAKKQRGQAAMIDDRPYIVTLHESTSEPVYHAVAITEG